MLIFVKVINIICKVKLINLSLLYQNNKHMKTEQQFKDELEQFIDSNSFLTVVRLLQEISDEKSSHLRECWQSENQAKEYDRLSNRIFTLYSSLLKYEITL